MEKRKVQWQQRFKTPNPYIGQMNMTSPGQVLVRHRKRSTLVYFGYNKNGKLLRLNKPTLSYSFSPLPVNPNPTCWKQLIDSMFLRLRSSKVFITYSSRWLNIQYSSIHIKRRKTLWKLSSERRQPQRAFSWTLTFQINHKHRQPQVNKPSIHKHITALPPCSPKTGSTWTPRI